MFFKGLLALSLLAIVSLIVLLYPFFNFMNQFEITEYDKNLTLVFGSGGNSAVLAGENGVLVIDSKISSGKSKLYEIAKNKAGNKPITLINTHLHADHTSGNYLYKGQTIIAGAYSKEQWVAENGEEGLPTEWLKDTKEIKIGDETVVLKNLGQGHTYQDVVVFFKNRKMLFTGDLITIGLHPFLKTKNGSKISLYLEKQNFALNEFNPEKIVPGHGQMGGKELVSIFQNYFLDTKAVAQGRTEAAVIEEKYKDWVSMPIMSGTSATVNYWKKELAE